MKTKKKKDFDTVKMMREIRDKISKETMNMNFEELKKYMSERLNKGEAMMEKRNDYSRSKPKV